MNIVFRVDAFYSIGFGHWSRCLALAVKLQAAGHRCFMLSSVNAEAKVSQPRRPAGLPICLSFNATWAEQTGDQFVWPETDDATLTWQLIEQTLDAKQIKETVVVVDHYQLSATWHRCIGEKVKKLVVIDDLANRYYACDLLIDPTLVAGKKAAYKPWLLNKQTQLAVGPDFLILADAYLSAARGQRFEVSKADYLHLFFGGSDPLGITLRVLKRLKAQGLLQKKTDVVVGRFNPKARQIKKFCQRMGIEFHQDINDMHRLLKRSHLYIGAGGVSLLERLALAKAGITLICADNQTESARAAGDLGLTESHGLDCLSGPALGWRIKKLMRNSIRQRSMVRAARQLLDGYSMDRLVKRITETSDSPVA